MWIPAATSTAWVCCSTNFSRARRRLIRRNFSKFQKLVRRNKVTFATGAGIAAALVIGLAIALWQSIEKTRAYNRAVAAEQEAIAARKRAETNEQKAQANEREAQSEAAKLR